MSKHKWPVIYLRFFIYRRKEGRIDTLDYEYSELVKRISQGIPLFISFKEHEAINPLNPVINEKNTE